MLWYANNTSYSITFLYNATITLSLSLSLSLSLFQFSGLAKDNMFALKLYETHTYKMTQYDRA